MPNIPIKILEMDTEDGFDKLFEQEIPNHDTYKDAFWAVESEYREFMEKNKLVWVFGPHRYKNYESYRIARRKRIKKDKT